MAQLTTLTAKAAIRKTKTTDFANSLPMKPSLADRR